MLHRTIAPLALLALLLGGCGEVVVPACPDAGTALTYDNFGAGYFGLRCNYCHGALVTDRQGAPTDFTFDTLDEVRRHRTRIYARATGERPSMPPGPDKPPPDEIAKLAEWLACVPP